MTAIWHEAQDRWSLINPAGFQDEATLHKLIELNPQILPLAGSPSLVVLGTEVQLGVNWADLIAIERSGRLVLIEVKLAKNAEARRAVVAQLLAYAAHIHGVSLDSLERSILGSHLRKRGYGSLVDAVKADYQQGQFDAAAFNESLCANLEAGAFRLVFVLDQAPDELVRLVGYLEAIAPQLTIDLVTVSLYQIGDQRVLVPQRVEPERQQVSGVATVRQPDSGYTVPGGDDFGAAIGAAPKENQPLLQKLYDWAVGMEKEGLCTLLTYHGKTGNITLLPYVVGEQAGMVTIWNGAGVGSMTVWRSVFERRAPNSLPSVEAAISPTRVGVGNAVRNPTDEQLAAIKAAYQEAANQRV